MNKSTMHDVLKKQFTFMFTGVVFIIMSLIGLIIFAATGKYFMHPFLYIIILLMGIGWTLTAIVSIKSNRM